MKKTASSPEKQRRVSLYVSGDSIENKIPQRYIRVLCLEVFTNNFTDFLQTFSALLVYF